MNTACVPMSHAMPESAPAAADDGALVRRSMSGDIRAFELLYRKHVGRVHGAILRIVGMNHARAEELTQDAFVRAWQKLGGFRFESAFSTWLYRLGVNVAGNRVVNLLDVAPASATDLAEQALLGEAAVEDALRDLTRRGWVVESSGTYRLTEGGRSLRADLLRSATEFTAARLEGIDPADLDAARRVLVRLLTQ